MLHIILLILKITGIILLCVVGLILLLLAAALFVPLRYKADIKYTKDSKKAVTRLSWLWHIIHIKAGYDGETPSYTVRFFGYPLIDSQKEKKPEKKKAKKEKPKRKKETEVKNKAELIKETEVQKKIEVKEEVEIKKEEKQNEDNLAVHTIDKQPEKQPDKPPDKPGPFKRFYLKVKNIWNSIKAFFTNFRKKLIKISERIKALCMKKDKLLNILQSKQNCPAFFLLKQSGFKLLTHVAPRKVRGYLHFGMSDPAATGYCLGVLGILYPLYAPKFDIVPEFEKKIFEAELYVSGRIRSFVILKIVLKIILNKELKRIHSELKSL